MSNRGLLSSLIPHPFPRPGCPSSVAPVLRTPSRGLEPWLQTTAFFHTSRRSPPWDRGPDRRDRRDRDPARRAGREGPEDGSPMRFGDRCVETHPKPPTARIFPPTSPKRQRGSFLEPDALWRQVCGNPAETTDSAESSPYQPEAPARVVPDGLHDLR